MEAEWQVLCDSPPVKLKQARAFAKKYNLNIPLHVGGQTKRTTADIICDIDNAVRGIENHEELEEEKDVNASDWKDLVNELNAKEGHDAVMSFINEFNLSCCLSELTLESIVEDCKKHGKK